MEMINELQNRPGRCFLPKHGAGQLVGARCGLPATGVAQELCRDIFGAHAFAEFCYRLQVAVASARKADVFDFVSVARELDRRRANASSLESLFHMCLGVEGALNIECPGAGSLLQLELYAGNKSASLTNAEFKKERNVVSKFKPDKGCLPYRFCLKLVAVETKCRADCQ